MKKSEINKLARSVIKNSYGHLKTKEDYKEAFNIINDVILPKQVGASKFIMEQVQRVLANKFSKLFIKKKQWKGILLKDEI